MRRLLVATLLGVLLTPLNAFASDDETTPQVLPTASEEWGYRPLTEVEFNQLVRVTDVKLDRLVRCVDAEESQGRRARQVDRAVLMTLFVGQDGGLVARYDGEDPEGEIQECFDERIGKMELNDAPEELAHARFTTYRYTDNFFQQRRKRHGEIIALYTLSGVTAAVGIGAFVAARADDRDMDRRLAETPATGASRSNISERPDRLRTAGWSMAGVSIASFVVGTLLMTRNMEIEEAENPTYVLSPGAPGANVGLSFSGRF